MNLFRRTDSPYWWYVFTIDGQRFRDSTKRPLNDKKGAMAVMNAEYTKALNMGQLGHKPEITLKDAFDLTLDEVEGQTLRVYKTQATKLLKVLPKTKLASSLTQGDLDALLARRKKAGEQGNTIRCEFKFLRRALSRVKRTHKVNADLEWPNIKGFTKTRYLSKAEERAVLARLQAGSTITDAKAYELCIILLDTGLRLMEAVEVDWVDIDMTNRTIEVYRTKTGIVSTVPISNRVYEILSRKTNQPKPFEKMEWAVKNLRKVIGAECNQSKRLIEQRGKATIHTLRDTFASRLLQQGMSLHKLSKLLGHTTITQTAKYAQLENLDVVSEAREMMDAS
ncbi:Site-specific recombinase XerD [Roseovarius mucosus DSM 17069]|uniref:Site-specific recombinase XerD n=1 Tax=Roseovarius mucosus DSM 17069 TaxID=1288298 RepID=A0A0A0HGU1_9RHOB|nr:site-specific integrase [Roseovarius mucosus]KGM86221.1 Site-specific recombinase XerD [Roseovarius mucosus DSM 17069]